MDNLTICTTLMADPKIDPNAQDALGNGALHFAIEQRALSPNNPFIIKYLLNDARTNVDLENHQSETPLDTAIRCYYYHEYVSDAEFSSTFQAVNRGTS